MSWLDEELARQAARDAMKPAEPAQDTPLAYKERAEQQVRALDALVQQLLADYGERAMGRNFRGRQFGTLLEAPGQRPGARRGETEYWSWHWHLHSYVRGVPGLEVHPEFDEEGTITAVMVGGGSWQERCAPDEEGIKATLIHAFKSVHGSRMRK
ncbi:MAG TPA: hypothetical protein VF040_14090 [Ktedonobacterales bacterium]